MLILMLTPTERCLKAKPLIPYLLLAMCLCSLQNKMLEIGYLNGVKVSRTSLVHSYSSREKKFVKSRLLMVPLLRNGNTPKYVPL